LSYFLRWFHVKPGSNSLDTTRGVSFGRGDDANRLLIHGDPDQPAPVLMEYLDRTLESPRLRRLLDEAKAEAGAERT
jgi:hypothetical protein